MRTNVYIDGFNLYNGAVKGTPFKWLNLAALCRHMLPRHHITRIRYFTAHVSARPASPSAPANQQIYLRALRTIPNLDIHLGQFLSHPRRMPLANGPADDPQFVTVTRTEEKGTDVNLATYLLFDAFRDEYDCAVVLSNDSDLVEPIRIVKEHLSKKVGLINPHKHPSKSMKVYASFYKPIREGVLSVSQFPPVMTDTTGTFTKPVGW